MAFLLLSCAGEEARPTVELWHSYRGAEKAAIDALAADFNAGNHDFDLEVLAVASKAYKTKLSSAVP